MRLRLTKPARATKEIKNTRKIRKIKKTQKANNIATLVLRLGLGAALLTVTLNSFAVIPVTDVGAIANLVKNYNQLKQQYDLLHHTYQNAQQQLDKAKQIANDAEGHYGYGNLLNSAQDLKKREWSPSTWDDALKGLSGGNPERYQQLVNTYKQNHKTLSQSDYEQGASSDQAKTYKSIKQSVSMPAMNLMTCKPI